MKLTEILKENKYIYSLGRRVIIIYVNYFLDSYKLLKVKLRYWGILKEKKYESIKLLQNSHKGERCFIVGTGPSLTLEDVESLKGEFVMGVNSLVKLLGSFSYRIPVLGIQDPFVFDKIGSLIEHSEVETVFVTDTIYDKIRKNDKSRYIRFPLYSCRHAAHSQLMPLATDFTDDASKVVYSGYSITYSLLQIAVYMGFSEIYLLGCDCSYNTNGGKNYFVDHGFVDKYAGSAGERIIYAFQTGKNWLDKNRPDVSVYNATRGGMLEVFPRRNLDEIDNLKSKINKQ